MQFDPTGKTQTSAEKSTGPATPHWPREQNAIRLHREDASENREADEPSHSTPAPQQHTSRPGNETAKHAEGPTSPATPHRFHRHSAIRPHNQDTSERREADKPSHSALAPQAHRNSTPHGRHKLAQRSRQAQPLRTGPASIVQSEPTGKTQASTERPACPATLHRPREHNTIRPHAEDASERRGRRAQQVRAGPASAARGSIQRSRRCYSPSGPSSAAIHPCGPYRICNPSQRQVQRCKHCGTRGGRPAGLTALRPRVGKGGPSSSARPPRGNKQQPGGA